jgi:hypothetical protein
MISRREMVTAGVMGSLAAAAPAAAEAAELTEQPELQKGLADINSELGKINAVLDDGLIGPLVEGKGYIQDLRKRFKVHLKSAGKFPEFCDIGILCFYEVYDWHVRHMQAIQITRAAENRMAIQFMFTQLVLRWEQDEKYVGQPYDMR